MRKQIPALIDSIGVFIIFILHYFYFAFFCKYHLAYQEQIQLFRFSPDFLKEFLTRPGGLSEYLGAFLIQFYQNPWIAAGVVTFIAILLFIITRLFFRQNGIHGIFWSIVPVLLLIALQSHHHYFIGSSVALILSICVAYVYTCRQNKRFRVWIGILSWIILYILTAGYAFLCLVLIVLTELSGRNKRKWIVTAGFLTTGILVLFFATQVVWYVSLKNAMTNLLPLQIQTAVKYSLYALIIYYPLVLAGNRMIIKISLFRGFRGIKSYFAGVIAILAIIWWVQRKACDTKTEMMLGMDCNIQHGLWDDVLYLSSQYPGSNRVVTYFTNLALFNKGSLLENLFSYNQIGSDGLFLKWENNNLTPLFGGEFYYQIGYTNEAQRWAFEAMVANGLNPRSLKRLVLTNLINGDVLLAEKYLHFLQQTLYYRKWAKKYLAYLHDSTLLDKDKEIGLRKNLKMKIDFWAGDEDFKGLLLMILKNHPENIMAFEYNIACLMLEKDLDALVNELPRLEDFGYAHIPENYEEAILVYSALHKKNVVPEGYFIRNETQVRFENYLRRLGEYRNNPELAAKSLYRDFSNTYWYYMNFYGRK